MKHRHGSIEARCSIRMRAALAASCLIAAASTLAPAAPGGDREPPRFDIRWQASAGDTGGAYAASNPVHGFRVLFQESGLRILDEPSGGRGPEGFELELGLHEYASAGGAVPVSLWASWLPLPTMSQFPVRVRFST